MKKYLYLLLLLAFLIYWCACHKSHPNENRDPFTEDQLQWIECIENPSYKVSTKELDTAGNEITVVDTLIANTNSGTSQTSDVINDDYAIYYYCGSYQFFLGKAISGDTNVFTATIEIDNEFDFAVKIRINIDIYNILPYQPDTAKINDIVYTDVFKLVNLPIHFPQSITECYYKKGLGFIYFKKSNGNTAEIIQ